MRLKLDIPAHWPCLVDGVSYEPVPAVTVTIEPLIATPAELRAWGDRVVLEAVDRSSYRVRNVEDLKTDRGWPVTIFFSDILSMMPESGAVPQPFGGPRAATPSRVIERRLHALYLFSEYCGVAIARTRTPARFDAAMPEIRKTLLTGDLDWASDKVLSLAELWAGLDVTRDMPKPPPAPNQPPTGTSEDPVK